MTPCDPMAVAVDWLDAYRAARINQIVGMHAPDAVIECACGGRKIIHGQDGIAAYWRDRFIESPALEQELRPSLSARSLEERLVLTQSSPFPLMGKNEGAKP